MADKDRNPDGFSNLMKTREMDLESHKASTSF